MEPQRPTTTELVTRVMLLGIKAVVTIALAWFALSAVVLVITGSTASLHEIALTTIQIIQSLVAVLQLQRSRRRRGFRFRLRDRERELVPGDLVPQGSPRRLVFEREAEVQPVLVLCRRDAGGR